MLVEPHRTVCCIQNGFVCNDNGDNSFNSNDMIVIWLPIVLRVIVILVQMTRL